MKSKYIIINDWFSPSISSPAVKHQRAWDKLRKKDDPAEERAVARFWKTDRSRARDWNGEPYSK